MDVRKIFQINRRIASGLAPVLACTPLTPNHVTSLSLFTGLVSAFSVSFGTRSGMLTGAFFLQLSFILDDCDGALARLRLLQSTFGMWYDFVADLLVDVAMWVGLTLGALRQGADSFMVLVGVAACAGSLINFLRVIQMRVAGGRSGKEPPRPSKNPLYFLIHALSRDGDPTLLVWLMALVGNASAFLIFGCIYIQILWVCSIWIPD